MQQQKGVEILAEAVEMRDRRDDPRADIEVEVDYRTPTEFLSAYSRNISGGGIFIRTWTWIRISEGSSRSMSR